MVFKLHLGTEKETKVASDLKIIVFKSASVYTFCLEYAYIAVLINRLKIEYKSG